jgi:hypothetical protein
MKMMSILQPTEEMRSSPETVSADVVGVEEPRFSLLAFRPGTPWNFTTVSALLVLVVLWAVKVYMTWAAWGDVTIDSGHEMYVPALLAEGKTLYRDTFFSFGPASVYFNSYLFRMFGIQLSVLYWAGSLSALGSAIFLYLAGMRLSSWIIGWTAGGVVLLEAFQPSLFCFPLPYSFAAVYGCLLGCLFVWLIVEASTSKGWHWIFAAASTAAVALLVKPEFGLACYATLSLLIAIRCFMQRSWKITALDILAVLPGVVLCALVIRWMVSIAGVDFITQENVLSWPTSYFMRTYGKSWLEQNGFTISASAFHEALFRTIPIAAALSAAYCVLWWKRSDKRSMLWKGLFILAGIIYFVRDIFLNILPPQQMELTLSTVFFPQDMVLYVIVATGVVWSYFWRGAGPVAGRSPAVPLLFTFSSLLAFRILMKMAPGGYAIYYNGPVVLMFLLLLCLIIPRSGRSRRFVLAGELVICVACLIPVVLHARDLEAAAKKFVPLTTPRGTVRVSKHKAENYAAAIQFMKQKASLGQSVLSVPEDTSLYFLSETECPVRVYTFDPGVVAPGKMTDDMIRQIERQPVSYLLWSNRTFVEYGVPVFGKDFDRELGDYLKSHYRPVGPIMPNTGNYWEWTATIWEHKPDAN